MVGSNSLFLLQVADHFEAQTNGIFSGTWQRHGRFDSRVGVASLPKWRELIESILDRDVATLNDLAALSRICRSVRAWTVIETDELREALDKKLQAAVIEVSENMNRADAGLLELHDQFMELEKEARTLSQSFSDDDDAGDTARELLLRKQKNIVCKSRGFEVVSPVGHQALARMLLTWSNHIKPCNRDSDSGEEQLLWLLLRNLLGIDHATALASDDPDVVLHAIGKRHGQDDVSPEANVVDFPVTAGDLL